MFLSSLWAVLQKRNANKCYLVSISDFYLLYATNCLQLLIFLSFFITFLALLSVNVFAQSNAELQKLVKLLNDMPSLKIRIGGHTDSKGSDVYNQKFNHRRYSDPYFEFS